MPQSHHRTSTFPLCADQTQTGLVGPSTRRRVSPSRRERSTPVQRTLRSVSPGAGCTQ